MPRWAPAPAPITAPVTVIAALVTALAAAPAAAQVVAAPPVSSTPAPVDHHPHAGLGIGVALGAQHQAGLDDGWVARLEYAAYPALAPRGRWGGVFGFAPGVQVWRGGHDWGVGVPVAIQLGVRAPGLRAVGMVGIEAFSIEVVADDTGVGLYQPFAGAQLAVEARGWYLGLDARVTRRWQIGAPDHTQWQLAATLGYTLERQLREPIR